MGLGVESLHRQDMGNNAGKNDVRDLKEGLKGLEQRLERKGKEVTAQIDNTVFRVSCNIKPPPAQVQSIHKEIIKLIKTALSQHGCELIKDNNGPTLVTVVNSSRTQEDIERDMLAAKLSGSEASDVILLRIVPSLNHSIKVKKMSDEHYKLDQVFIAEQSAQKLKECPQNMQACDEIIQYLCKNLIDFE